MVLRLKPTDSSVIAGYYYDGDDERLYICFRRNGKPDALYEYYPVADRVADEFTAASSKGTYFSQNIRHNSTYTCTETNLTYTFSTYTKNWEIAPEFKLDSTMDGSTWF